VITLLMLAVLQQAPGGPDVIVSASRDHVAPGDVLTFTIRVTSRLADPIRVELPSLGGFELESRQDKSDVLGGSGGGRFTTVQLSLRAVTPGEWRIGPVMVRQGTVLSQADPITITIEGGAPAPATANVSQRLARIIQRAPPPDGMGQAGITVALSDADVLVGEQVDVVTIAWFDRELRQELRRAPTVESPSIDGVWSYPQPVPGGIAATRQVGGRWYDLFVLHQVVFPLTPGRVAVSAARLQYSVPLANQFFSQEEAYKLESEPTSFLANVLPAEGREPTFAGAVGRGLTISQMVTPAAGRQGEAFSAEITVRGEGNVALWPEPDVRWPPSFRVYPEAAREQLAMTDGHLGGAKTFKFLLVADSAGALALPALRYPYFDLGIHRYRVAEGASALVIVAPRGEAVASRAEPPPIRLDRRQPAALILWHALPLPAWWVIALAPAGFLLVRRLPRRRPRARVATVSSDSLGNLERRLDAALDRGGLDPAIAADLALLRERVLALRFAPAGTGDLGPLVASAEAALAGAGVEQPSRERRWRVRTGLTLALLLTVAPGARAQTQPEELYNAGAYRAAEEGFRRRALGAPEVPTHWFNLGDAAYRGGDDAAALMAWVRAARLSPRDGGIRRALLLVAPADAGAASWLWVAPFTPAELWLLGLVCWLAGWGGVVWSRRFAGRWVVLIAGGVLLFAGADALHRWYEEPIAIASNNEQLRLSPHELAPAVGEVPRLGTVRLGHVWGAWVEADAGAGQRGWMRLDALEALSGRSLR